MTERTPAQMIADPASITDNDLDAIGAEMMSGLKQKMRDQLGAEYASASDADVLQAFLALHVPYVSPPIPPTRAEVFAASPLGFAVGVIQLASMSIMPIAFIAWSLFEAPAEGLTPRLIEALSFWDLPSRAC